MKRVWGIRVCVCGCVPSVFRKNKMYSEDGYAVGDGSWTLSVFVTDLGMERSLRVKGDLHIGGVMLKLVEDLGVYQLLTLLQQLEIMYSPPPSSNKIWKFRGSLFATSRKP